MLNWCANEIHNSMHEEKRKQLVEEKKMKNLKHDIGCRLVKIFAVVLATMPFLVCWYAVFADTIPMPVIAVLILLSVLNDILCLPNLSVNKT